MSVIALGDLYQFFNDVRRRGAVGVAHAQVDDVLATTACGHLEFGGDVEDVRGETINARKAARRTLVSHGFLEDVSARNRPSDVGHCGGRGGKIERREGGCKALLLVARHPLQATMH
ncbi:hypothetical protein D9M71_394750 [compost metagenome]